MIAGIGTDIVDIRRIRSIYEKFGVNFVRKILSPTECTEFKNITGKPAFLARRFAVKEALVKALGTGFRGLWFSDITITHDNLGKPEVTMRKRIPANMKIHVSISDERNYAFALVILEK